MPLFPSLNDLKGITISINPLSLFDPSTSKPADAAPASSSPSPSHSAPRAEAGPGPSSLSLSNRLSAAFASSPLAGVSGSGTTGSPLAPARQTNGAPRPALKSNSSDSGASLGSDGQPRPTERRRASGQVMIQAEEPRRRERRKKVPMDSYVIVKPPPMSSKNPLNLQIQLVFKAPAGRRERSESGVGGPRSPGAFSTASGLSMPLTPTPTSARDNGGIDGLPSSAGMHRGRSDSPTQLSDKEEVASLHSLGACPGPIPSTSTSTGAPLRRVGSRKSSTSTVASASTTGGAKRIQPMFNLSVHNVMQPTLVTDAGTDAKVAKFSKRSIDVMDVGVLEPAEIWLPQPGTNIFGGGESASASRPLSTHSFATTAPISPIASRASIDAKLRSDFVAASAGVETGAKKFFGKVGSAFKKKEKDKLQVPEQPVSGPHAQAASPKLGASEHGQPNAHGHGMGPPTFGCAPTVVARRESNPTISPDGAITGLAGASASTSASSEGMCVALQPSARPVGYTWTVKRWAKSNTEGWAAHLVAAAAQGLEMVHSLHAEGDNEVVFEWVKMRGDLPRSRARRASDAGRSVKSGFGPAMSSAQRWDRAISMLQPPSASALCIPASGLASAPASAPTSEAGDSPPERDRAGLGLGLMPPSRPSSLRASTSPGPGRTGSPRRQGTPTPTPSIKGGLASHANGNGNGNGNGVAPDDASQTYTFHTADEDSDPEDSETPWTCSLWVKRTNQRQLLATLTPAPHHPKVVGQLKIPMKLESVTLADLKGGGGEVVKGGGKQGSGRGSAKAEEREEMRKRVEKAVCIGEESLKDVVCVTALWLVAREGWGGLGKRRKA